jgi:hypothetical protein
MKRISLSPKTQLIAVMSVFAAVAAAMVATSGNAAGTSSAAQYQYGAPVNTAVPVVSGTAAVGSTLTTTNGTWKSDSTVTYSYQWVSCDANGAACVDIAGANASTYKVASADSGRRLRANVDAKNSVGTTETQSAPTAAVTQPANKLLQAADVKLPNRLIVDKVAYSANPIRSRTTPTQMKVHVADSFGNSVQGSSVYAIGIPYSRIRVMPEVTTDATGWATLSITAGQKFPRTGYLVLFVRARVPGQDALGGTSTRRLVQVTIGAPTG